MAKIVAIEDDDEVETYDIWNMEDDCYEPPSGATSDLGNFVIDGFVVHNSILANQSTCFEDLMLFNAMGHPGPMACVKSDSLINTDMGHVRIDQLQTNTQIAYLTSAGYIAYTSNYAVVPSGRKKLVKVTLTDGRIIVVSPDHRILTSGGYKTSSELTGDDEVVCDDL